MQKALKHLLGVPVLLIFTELLPVMTHAQRPLRFYLNGDSTAYIGFRLSGQTWMRYSQNNPGTLINGEETSNFFDISVRRVRMQAFGFINEKTSINVSVGQNNINYLSASSGQIRLLDMYVERRLTPWLTVGGGQSAWNGLSRYASPNTSRNLTLDVPMVAIPTVNLNDNVLRKLGAFVHGQWKSFDYRAVFSRPYASLTQPPMQGISSFSGGKPGMQIAVYLKYYLIGKETQSSSFHPFTYQGTKRILVIGVGSEYQKDAMWRLEGVDTVKNNLKLLAVDIFGELPTVSKTAFTAYLGYFNYQFGPDFIRMIGVNNIASGVNSRGTFNGAGNKFPAAGTGQTLLAQLGYYVPINKEKDHGLQVFSSWQYSHFEGLSDPVIYQESGLSFLLPAQSSKLSLAVQSWPYYRDDSTTEKPIVGGRKQSFILQYQVRLE